VPKGFIGTPINVLCLNFVKFGRLDIGKVMRCLPNKKTKFCPALSLSLLHRSRQKSATASAGECNQSAADFIQIGSLSAGIKLNA